MVPTTWCPNGCPDIQFYRWFLVIWLHFCRDFKFRDATFPRIRYWCKIYPWYQTQIKNISLGSTSIDFPCMWITQWEWLAWCSSSTRLSDIYPVQSSYWLVPTRSPFEWGWSGFAQKVARLFPYRSASCWASTYAPVFQHSKQQELNFMSIRLSVLFLQPKNLENHKNLLKKFQRKKRWRVL